MEKETVIEIKDLKIDYRNLNHFSLQQMIRNPALKGRGVIHALRGLDLEVKEGEILGIIGANGAGKSTLLKAIAGIFQPDFGSIDTKGRRVSLMSLGVGFKWDLSGRDNIMIAGMLLHYKAPYIRSKMQEIIDFSELGDDIDRPVRTYSSGMYSKLSFAITAVLETDIMLIDELLSVGDEKFQAKSYEKIRSLVNDEKTTSLIVSHDMDLLRRICGKVVWMDKGRFVAAGEPDRIIDKYIQWSAEMGAPELHLFDDFKGTGAKGKERIACFRGLDVQEHTGKLINVAGEAGFDPLAIAVNWEPLFVRAGDSIALADEGLLYRVFTYKNEINNLYIYMPCTSTEGNRTIYSPETSELKWIDGGSWSAPEDMYIRIELMKKNGRVFTENTFLEDLICIRRQDESGQKEDIQKPLKNIFHAEASDCIERVNSLCGENDAILIVLADSHFAFGGNWADTAFCLQQVSKKVLPDALVHLGDLTDGRYPACIDYKVTGQMYQDMQKCCSSVHICYGNHDNYTVSGGKAERRYYFEDLPLKGVRLIFLESFDAGKDPQYGFSDAELSWLSGVLQDMPGGFRAVIFSHVNICDDRTKWDEEIQNAGRLRRLLDDFCQQRPGGIAGVLCGHDHEDKINAEHAYPVISTGCSVLEDHKGTRPLYDGRFTRKAGEVSQELFDIVIIKEDRMELIRFGAGGDRHAEVKR